jgi:hypothetical protein
MPRLKHIVPLLIIFIAACAAYDPYIRSIAQEDVRSLLERAPRAQDHPNAGADLLFAYSYVELREDGTIVNRNLYRVKIFNERGRNFATVTIPYREGYQQVDVLFATTIRPDGQIVPLNRADIHDSSAYGGYEFYTDIKEKKFAMPAVEDNCVIEYAYEVRDLKPVLSMDFATGFYCRNFFPIEEDIMEIVVPAGVNLKFKNFNTEIVPRISLENKKKKYVFVSRKQQEIIAEPRMPSLSDKSIYPQILIWTLDKWDTISQWYANLVREQMTSDTELESFTRKLIEGKATDEEKMNAIFKFVSQNVRYVAVLMGPHTHQPHSAKEIFLKRYGDCKDKTVLLLTMLKIAGIEAMPALVPADRNDFDDQTPSLQVFNHVIAVVPHHGRYYWLDATNETAAFDSPPFQRPTEIFLIKPDGSFAFLKTPPMDDKKDFFVQDLHYDITAEGDASLDFTYRYYGKAAELIRYFFKYSSPEQRKNYFEKMGIEVSRLELGNFTQTEEPFVIKLTGKIKNAVQVLDSETMLLSDVISYDTYRDITASPRRVYPVELNQTFPSLQNKIYRFPAGFKIKRLPKDFFFTSPFKIIKEKYDFRDSTFYLRTEEKNLSSKINVQDLEAFKMKALELQKHESSVKNLLFIKK